MTSKNDEFFASLSVRMEVEIGQRNTVYLSLITPSGDRRYARALGPYATYTQALHSAMALLQYTSDRLDARYFVEDFIASGLEAQA